MNTINSIVELAELRKQKFKEYEQATIMLSECDEDSAEHYITQRGDLSTEIDDINQQIGKLCDSLPNGTIVLQASMASIAFEMLSPDLFQLYEIGQETRSIVYGIQQEEKTAMQHLEIFRDAALEKIRENQHMPKIKQYLTNLGSQQDNQNFSSGKA